MRPSFSSVQNVGLSERIRAILVGDLPALDEPATAGLGHSRRRALLSASDLLEVAQLDQIVHAATGVPDAHHVTLAGDGGINRVSELVARFGLTLRGVPLETAQALTIHAHQRCGVRACGRPWSARRRG